jgi:hypothetical protein
LDVILEYPATPDETRAIMLAFAAGGIDAALRAAPRRRAVESPVWRVVVSTPLHELLVSLDVPRAGAARALQALVVRIARAWRQGPSGHIEVGPRGARRRATGGVLLTADLPIEAYDQLVKLASGTLDAERLFLWNAESGEWSTFDVDVPVEVASGSQRSADVAGERVERRFRRSG